MNTLKSSREKVIPYAVESLRYRKRLGSTMYTVNVYQSQTSRETMQDKILRLVKNDAGGDYGDNSTGAASRLTYVQWMKVFNLQTAARTLIFLQDHGIDSYDELCEKSSAASGEFHRLSKQIKEIEIRQKEISELQKHIGNYGKGRTVNERYKASGYDQNFFEEHRAALTLYKTAKCYFDSLGMKKLPSINSLTQEWATINAERRKLYSGYKAAKQKFAALGTAKTNADHILGINKNAQAFDAELTQRRGHGHGR